MADTAGGGGGFNLGSHVSSWVKTPMEGLAGLVMLYVLLAAVGIYVGLFTMKQAVTFSTAILGVLAVLALNVIGPAAVVGLVVALVTAIHNWKKALVEGVACAVVIFISAHYGGFDWLGQVNSIRNGMGH